MPRAPMPRPANPAPLLWIRDIQRPAGISLKRVHDKFRRDFRVDHDMHVIGAHLRGKQLPLLVSADSTNRFESNLALISVQLERLLLKQGCHVWAKHGLRLRQPSARHVMVAVRCALLTRNVRSVAGEGNEISGYDS